MRPLFQDAPILQQSPTMQSVPSSSGLAAALSGHMGGMPNLPSPSMGNIPLASLAQAMQQGQTPSAGAMNNAPTGQGNMIQPNNGQWSQSTAQPQDPSMLNQIAPQMPGTISGTNPNAGSLPINYTPPGMPTAGMPGVPPMLGQVPQQ